MEQAHHERYLHLTSLGFANIVFFLFVLYAYASGSQYLLAITQASAATASVMIGLSFALSGFCYYFDFLDSKIVYRKYFGLMGYWFALLHCALLLMYMPETYVFGLREAIKTPEAQLGIVAMSILTFMAIISNNKAMKILGPKNWRRGLRLGYVAYTLLIIRAFLLEKHDWSFWWEVREGLPPIRLLITLFALSVLLLRFSMLIVKPLRQRQAAAQLLKPNTASPA